MDQNPNNSKENDNLKESCEQLDASNGKDMKNIEGKMQKLEIEGRENQKMEGQMEIEKRNEAKKEYFYVPNWLVEVLEWIKRMEMADSKLSTSSWAFNELCGPKLHGKKVKPHMVGRMVLAKKRDDSGNMRAIALYGDGGQLLPIPSTSPPDYISGFKRINILFLDDRVLEFIKCISSKLRDIKFKMRMNFEGWKLDGRDERSRAIQCLLNMLADRIAYLCFDWRSNIKMFNSHFPDFINKYQCLSISSSIQFRKPEFDLLFEWLTNRRQMDATKQKVLELTPDGELAYFIGRIKEEFSNATKPLNFLISFPSGPPFFVEYDFNLENGITAEVLNSYRSQQFGRRTILRCPIGQEERWEKEGEEKMKKFDYPYSDDVTRIKLDIRQFGTFTDLAKYEQE